MRLEGHIDVVRPDLIAGWARDVDAPGRPLSLVAYTGQALLGTCLADARREDLALAGIGDHGFSFRPPHPLTPAERDRLHFRAESCPDALFEAYGGVQPNPFLAPPAPRPSQPRFRRCILHIGTEKTGSTSIQRFLAENREALADRGLYVPLTLVPADAAGALNHSDLAVLAMADWRLDDALRRRRDITDAAGLARFRANAAAAFAAEIATAPAQCDTLLLSSEHCHSRVLLMHEVAALRGFLQPWAEATGILVFLRPQHELAISHHAMQLVAGVPDAEPFPPLPYPDDYAGARTTDLAYFDYARLLSRWAAFFGRDAVRPLPYPAGGDVIDVFCEALGLSPDGLTRPPRLASSISPRAHRFLRQALPVVQAKGGEAAAWIAGFLTENLRRAEPGGGAPPSRAAAAAFLARFAEGNERVRAEWFPDRPALFPADFAAYPETTDGTPLDAAEQLDLLVALLRAAAQPPH